VAAVNAAGPQAQASPVDGLADEQAEPPAAYPPFLELREGSHSYVLVGLSLLLSLTAFLAISVLLVVGLAAASGTPAPLLAALPSSSAALLALQLLALAGREADKAQPLSDLGRPLAWALPWSAAGVMTSVLVMLAVVWVARRYTMRRCRVECGVDQRAHGAGSDMFWPPHGLTAGAWELRATGLLAFPTGAASVGMLRGDTDFPLLGAGVAICVLFVVLHHVLLSLKFVTEVVREGKVMRATLPTTAGGAEVFVDRVCDQLRALPVPPPPPGCPSLFGGWLSSPSWCIAPAVAVVREVEHRSLGSQESEVDGGSSMQWSAGHSWCTMEDSSQALRGDLEDELQGKPLLVRGLEREETDTGPTSTVHGGKDTPAPPSSGNGCSSRPSAVSAAHPVHVTTLLAYEVKARDLVAGVACVPWLDCAVPAGALRRIEELASETVFQAHPGQLSGSLCSGRFAACFDWGTRWPWRWPIEVALKVALGVWAAVHLDKATPLRPTSFLWHALMLTALGIFLYVVLTVHPYDHRHDNLATGIGTLVSALTVGLCALGDSVPALSVSLAVAAGALALVPCLLALLAAIGLASSALGRLEAQGLHEKLLPRTIAGWGSPDGVDDAEESAGFSRGPGATTALSSGLTGCGVPPDSDAGLDRHAVEVVFSGHRKALAIVLPAQAHPRVVQAQLLPPVAGRNGDPESLPPCIATGDRARLPVPAGLIFRNCLPKPEEETLKSESAAGGLRGRAGAVSSVAPLCALLAPGPTGRLVYTDEANNESELGWREAIQNFFGLEGSLLAEEAERLVEEHVGLENIATNQSVLVVIEVLPAWAAEFMDERHDPRGSM